MKILYVWLYDSWHLLKMFFASNFYLKPCDHYLKHAVEGKKAIVILPGILEHWSFMRPIADTLSFDGHPVYVIPKLKNNLLDIPSSALIVEEFILENNIDDAVIVAHSKGGLVGKYFLEYFNKDARVKGMVALATPFSGSTLAKLIPRKAFLELLPDSAIIRELDARKIANEKIISITPSFDNYVSAKDGSFLGGARENIVVAISGHHAVISNKETGELIKKCVQQF